MQAGLMPGLLSWAVSMLLTRQAEQSPQLEKSSKTADFFGFHSISVEWRNKQ
jgi:hypothetical protein